MVYAHDQIEHHGRTTSEIIVMSWYFGSSSTHTVSCIFAYQEREHGHWVYTRDHAGPFMRADRSIRPSMVAQHQQTICGSTGVCWPAILLSSDLPIVASKSDHHSGSVYLPKKHSSLDQCLLAEDRPTTPGTANATVVLAAHIRRGASSESYGMPCWTIYSK